MAQRRKKQNQNDANHAQSVQDASMQQIHNSSSKTTDHASGEIPSIDRLDTENASSFAENTSAETTQEKEVPSEDTSAETTEKQEVPVEDTSTETAQEKEDSTQEEPEKEDLAQPDNKSEKKAKKEKKRKQKKEKTDSEKEYQHCWMKRQYYILANAIYSYLYFVGIQLLRQARSRRRKIGRLMHGRLERIHAQRSFRKRSLRLYLLRTWSELCAPFREFRTKRAEFIKRQENVKRYGTHGMLLRLYFEMAGYFVVRFWKMLLFLLNYLAPIGVAVVMFWTVRYLNDLPMALQVTYNGEKIGYIENERIFNQAENEMKARIINEAYIRPEDTIPKFELALVNSENIGLIGRAVNGFLDYVGLQIIEKDQIISANDLTDELIQASGNDIQEADGLYISNRFVSAVTDGNKLLDYMNEMLEKYRTDDMDKSAKIQFVKKVELRHGLYPTSSVKPLSEVKERISGEERGEKTYTVVSGDDPLTIAAKNGITLKDLVSLNPEVTESLFIGDELLIAQSVPYLGVQVILTERREEEIDYQIEQRTNASENIGWTRTVQSGKKGLREIVETVKMVDGVEVERTAIESRVIQPPVTQILEVGGNRPLAFIPTSSSGATPSGTWGWPTVGGTITMPWMGYYNHTGSDISWSGCYGSPILASQDGTVVVTKYSAYGYGYHVIVDHGGGYQTLYAHMSRVDVVPGQQVSKGEQLGLIGQTGRTTGPHVHFEIRVNGRPTNAAPYLYGG